MMLSSEIFENRWGDLSEPEFSCPTPSMSEDFKKAFGGIPLTKLLTSEIQETACTTFDAAPIFVGPSISLESLGLAHGSSFSLEDEEHIDFAMFNAGDILEFNTDGNLQRSHESDSHLAQQDRLVEPSEYYAPSLFGSWEDDIFSGALAIIDTLEVQSDSPSFPVSPSFSGVIESSDTDVNIDDSDEDLDIIGAATPCTLSKRGRKQRTPSSSSGPSPKSSKTLTPKQSKKSNAASPKEKTSPKRRRRTSTPKKNTVTFAPEVEIALVSSSESILKVGKIGLLSSSTHYLSTEAIKNIFREEKVVTLSKIEDEDDEDVDIL